MDELWVPTAFARDVLLKSSIPSDSIRIMPDPFDMSIFSPNNCPTDPNVNKPFVFLSIFKWEKRKGWKELIQAFLEEFPEEIKSNKVQLLIKTSAFHLPPNSTPQSLAEERFPSLRNLRSSVVIRSTRVPEDELVKYFYCQANSVVAPSYGEGWGRVPAEASAMAIPVIYTNFSGMTEFLNDEIAFPIEVQKLVEGDEKGHLWAEPSIESLRKQMRYVYEQLPSALEKSRKAKAHMEAMYSLERVGKQVWAAAKELCITRGKKTSSNPKLEL
jgi:glycosyltransferase involved in cell wall biosynthesis